MQQVSTTLVPPTAASDFLAILHGRTRRRLDDRLTRPILGGTRAPSTFSSCTPPAKPDHLAAQTGWLVRPQQHPGATAQQTWLHLAHGALPPFIDFVTPLAPIDARGICGPAGRIDGVHHDLVQGNTGYAGTRSRAA